MKVLITGANGLVGVEVAHTFRANLHKVIVYDHNALDITDSRKVEAILEDTTPEWVINCAGYTKVDACEGNREMAFKVNGQAPGKMAGICKELGINLCHISSDYVFDGTKDTPYIEEDITHPINVYGQSKLAGERSIQGKANKYLIVRTQWLFGPAGPNFVSNILDMARQNKEIKVVDDQRGRPTYTCDLAKGIALLVKMDARGIYHVCNRGSASWYELAKKAAEYAEVAAEIIPVGTDKFPRPAKRPMNSILSTEKFKMYTEKVLSPWQIALKEYMRGHRRGEVAACQDA
ncbi:MAG: dTDP-4-dehydrorhamnose reductase [Thermodesulfobacteriota bacterium]|nr:dTDP-4-dehydrorhamnose reductase [Thermodesulfobacteriota bacterium]